MTEKFTPTSSESKDEKQDSRLFEKIYEVWRGEITKQGDIYALLAITKERKLQLIPFVKDGFTRENLGESLDEISEDIQRSHSEFRDTYVLHPPLTAAEYGHVKEIFEDRLLKSSIGYFKMWYETRSLTTARDATNKPNV